MTHANRFASAGKPIPVSGDKKIMKKTLFALLLLPALLRAEDPKPTPAQLEFFEKKIRPVLAGKCYECHSRESKVKGGLQLDTRTALLSGGDSGPAINLGAPEKSLLIKAISGKDKDLAMPPKGEKLTSAQVADFEAWIKMGAPDPRIATGKALSKVLYDPEKVKTHWAYQPVTKPTVPAAKDKWVQTPIDAFIFAKLQENGMKPSSGVDKRTLIRRASYDLIGLPPTAEEVDEFLRDTSSNAFAKVIDRLLASPHYGERWGRHWLDVARYADTKGDRNNRGNPLYPYAWTYRDYVINAFNKDLPFDRFVIEQIAADRVLKSEDKDKSSLAALGFLTVGKRFMGNANDVADDRIDAVTQGFLGLTAACARCHDHKFDPIPIKDYYSLHGIFASTFEPENLPVLVENKDTPEHKDYLAQIAAVDAELKRFIETESAKALAPQRAKVGEYLLAVWEIRQQLKDAPAAKAARADKVAKAPKAGNLGKAAVPAQNFVVLAREKGLEATILANWGAKLRDMVGTQNPILTPFFAFGQLPAEDFAAKAKELAVRIAANKDADRPVNPIIAKAFAGAEPKAMKDVAAIYSAVFKEVDEAWQVILKDSAVKEPKGKMANTAKAAKTKKGMTNEPIIHVAALPAGLPNKDQEALRQLIHGEDSAMQVSERDLPKLLGLAGNQFQNRVQVIRNKAITVDTTHTAAPVRAMVLDDLGAPRDSAVLFRGEPSNRGPVVPRQFLEVLSGEKREPFKDGSGRLDLAKAIASRDNPLTARVIVNRVWQWHFGEGIVTSASDFGMRAEKPAHAALLDHLATWFMDNGWSIKKLHRQIMLSSVYQQGSANNDAYAKKDPANQLFWKQNLQRLNFEALRDTLLVVGGKLDHTLGGRPVDVTSAATTRRTLYGLIDRRELPELFRTFDFANPDMTSSQRYNTTVPQQALFMMNSPLAISQAKNLAHRSELDKLSDSAEKVRQLYRLALQRPPSADELKLALEYVTKQSERTGGKTSMDAWEKFAQALLQTNELIYVN